MHVGGKTHATDLFGIFHTPFKAALAAVLSHNLRFFSSDVFFFKHHNNKRKKNHRTGSVVGIAFGSSHAGRDNNRGAGPRATAPAGGYGKKIKTTGEETAP